MFFYKKKVKTNTQTKNPLTIFFQLKFQSGMSKTTYRNEEKGSVKGMQDHSWCSTIAEDSSALSNRNQGSRLVS